MEWYIKIPLALIGVVELVVRITMSPVVLFLLMTSEREDVAGDYLRPWCFTHIQESERKNRSGNTVLSPRQRRKLEYMRQEQDILLQRKNVLTEINQLEGQIGVAFRPIL